MNLGYGGGWVLITGILKGESCLSGVVTGTQEDKKKNDQRYTIWTGYEEGPLDKECRCLLEYGKSKEKRFFPGIPREKCSPTNTDFRQRRPLFNFYGTER